MPKKSFWGAAIGTLVEYYDYALFSLFLPIIAPIFFSATSSYQALVKGYFVFLISMLARPFGGLFFGYIGDRFGRRRALLGSMYGIALATFVLGLTPAHWSIGIWAAVIVVIAKSVQMFCFGGEYNGAGIYVIEHTQTHKEGLVGSFLTATMLLGGLLASIIGVIATLRFMPAWSWRLAFILGGIIGVIGIIYRKNLLETPNFKTHNSDYPSILKLLKNYPRQLLAGIFIGGFATIPFTTALTFINPVLAVKGILSSNHFMLLQTFLTAIAIVTVVISGYFSDRTSPSGVMKIGALLLVFLPYPLLFWSDHHGLYSILTVEVLLIVINEIVLGPSNAYLKNAFSMYYRYRGSSLSFCLGMSILGGLTPIIENYLYQKTGHFSAVSLWLMFIGLGTFLSIKFSECTK